MEEQAGGNPNVIITTRTYNIVIDAWSKSDCEGAAQRAEEILCQMEHFHEHVKPDVDSFTGVIKAWVKSGNQQYAVSKSESIMKRMKQVSSPSGRQLSPSRRGYNLLLYALANSMLTDAGERAETILQTMKEEDAAGDIKSRPDVNSYNQVITAHCRGRMHGFEYKAQAAFDELMELPKAWNVKPNTDTFNAILGCWLKSIDRKAVTRMKEIMNIMQKCHSEGNDNARPNHITANTMITALGKGQDDEALEKAMAFYKDMESTYNITPDAVNNNILIDSYAKSGRSDAHERILEMLQGMEGGFMRGNPHVKPDAFTYSSAIDCLVRRGKPDAGKQAEAISSR